MLSIFINNKSFLLSKKCSVLELVNFLQLDKSILIIEYNHLVLPQLFWSKTYFSALDRLEFVTVVGGG